MRIGLVSDTHLPRFGTRLPAALVRGLREHGVEHILHLGDLTTPLAADLLEEIAAVDAVAGNNDGPDLVARYGRRKVVSLGGARIGMVHGDGVGSTTLRRAIAAFPSLETRVDLIGFGHSHIPYCARHGAMWVVNPGSPTDKRRNDSYSYGIVEIEEGRVVPSLHFYDDRSP